MSTLNTLRHSAQMMALTLLTLFGFNSCLSDGDYTIPLEFTDDTENLLVGEWQIAGVKELTYEEDRNGVRYEKFRDLPFDKSNQKVYQLYEDGHLLELGATKATQWSAYGTNLILNGTFYNIKSLGEKRMLTVDGDKCYDWKKVKTIDGEIDPEYVTSAVKVLSSTDYGTVRVRGISLTIPKGAVPVTESGNTGRIAFSIDLLDQTPYTLPSGYTLVSGVYKIEPMSFIFNSPLILSFDTYNNPIEDLVVFYYNQNNRSWEMVPFSRINSDGTAECSVLELGYFVLMKRNSSSSSLGGIRFDARSLSSQYTYYLLIESGSSYGLNGKMTFTSGANTLYLPFIPLSSYTLRLVRERRSDYQSSSTGVEYSNTLRVNVNSKLTGSGLALSNYEGWTEVSTSDFTWTEGRPSSWDIPTKTYGTGKFQATLTWTNTYSYAVDYDLHLVQPQSSEVYFGNKRSGCFELDRDWLTAAGRATENIYSIRDDFEKGRYKVYVHHYSGDKNITYSCRVVINGVLVRSYSGVLNSGSQTIYEFTIQ